MAAQPTQKKIVEQKEELLRFIENQQMILQCFDQQFYQQEMVSVSEREEKWYKEMSEKLAEYKESLYQLRLFGDSFVISLRNRTLLLEITGEGLLIFFQMKYTNQPEIPRDMSRYAHFRIQEVSELVCARDSPRRQSPFRFEILTSTVIKSISDIARFRRYVKPSSSTEPTTPQVGCPTAEFEVTWRKDKKKHILKVADRPEELEEVIGAHIRRFNRSFVEQVDELKARWTLSQESYDVSNPNHEASLLRLWEVVFPDVTLTARHTKQWGALGFQGKDPATDFRGMGILGLSLLLFFAENFTQQVRHILACERSYPFAVFGINLAHFLLTTKLGVNAKKIQTHSMDIDTWNSPTLHFLTTVYSKNAFEHTFCQLFLLFDALWVRMHASYMDFPRVLETLKVELTSLFSRRPCGLEQLSTWVDQMVIAILSGEQQIPETDPIVSEFESLSELVLRSAEEMEKKEEEEKSHTNKDEKSHTNKDEKAHTKDEKSHKNKDEISMVEISLS